MDIAVAGTGYVGLSLAVLLAQNNSVKAVDIVPDRAELINQGKSPFADKEIEEYLAEKPLDLVATTDGKSAYRDAEFIIVATPTNYDVERNYFDTSSIDAVLELVEKVNSSATVVIKSTVPVGYLSSVMSQYRIPNILFPRSSCVRGELSTIIFTRPASSWVPRRTVRLNCAKGRNVSHLFFRKGRWIRRSPRLWWTLPKLNPSNFSPIPISLCV